MTVCTLVYGTTHTVAGAYDVYRRTTNKLSLTVEVQRLKRRMCDASDALNDVALKVRCLQIRQVRRYIGARQFVVTESNAEKMRQRIQCRNIAQIISRQIHVT